jgi:MYXO-CTERM domain-containing protein
VHWGEACGNDFLRVDVPGVSVASPASLPLTGLALMAAAGAAARRRRSAARADAANA